MNTASQRENPDLRTPQGHECRSVRQVPQLALRQSVETHPRREHVTGEISASEMLSTAGATRRVPSASVADRYTSSGTCQPTGRPCIGRLGRWVVDRIGTPPPAPIPCGTAAANAAGRTAAPCAPHGRRPARRPGGDRGSFIRSSRPRRDRDRARSSLPAQPGRDAPPARRDARARLPRRRCGGLPARGPDQVAEAQGRPVANAQGEVVGCPGEHAAHVPQVGVAGRARYAFRQTCAIG